MIGFEFNLVSRVTSCCYGLALSSGRVCSVVASATEPHHVKRLVVVRMVRLRFGLTAGRARLEAHQHSVSEDFICFDMRE